MRWGLWGLEWKLQVFVVELVEVGGRIEASLLWFFVLTFLYNACILVVY